MIALKFLAAGAVNPFDGVRWPAPGEPFLESAPPSGVRACRPAQLAYWLNEELWRVELDGEITERETEVEGARGRLVARVEGWTQSVALELAELGARRARELAVLGLRQQGRVQEAAELQVASPTDLEACCARLRAGLDRPGAELLTYAATSAARARQGNAPSGAFMAAVAAAAVAGSRDGFVAERRRQAAWLIQRLGLTDL